MTVDAPMQSHNAPPRAPTEHRAIVEQVSDRRVEHRAAAPSTVTIPSQPWRDNDRTPARAIEREDDHEPSVVRAFETVERNRGGTTPCSEHPDDGEDDACTADQSKAHVTSDRAGTRGVDAN